MPIKDLTKLALALSSRPDKPKEPFRMTPAHDILLRGTPDMPYGLLQLQMARPDQLCRPRYSLKSVKLIQARLLALETAGYIQVDAIPTKFAKSPYIYLLSKKGINFLATTGTDVDTAYRPDKDADRHSLFISHTLDVNDVIVAAAALKREAMLKKVDPSYWLEKFEHERILKRHPIIVRWKGEEIKLIPDAILTFHVPHVAPESYPRIMLEHESSEKGQFAFRRKIRAYIELLKVAFQSTPITIAYTTTLGTNYLLRMLRWTWEELNSTNEPLELGRIFLFTTYEKPTVKRPIDAERLWLSPVWYRPYDEPPVAMLGG